MNQGQDYRPDSAETAKSRADNDQQFSTDLQTIEELESAVRSYCRQTPVVFSRAKGSLLYDCRDEQYIDFLSAAGSLNYGHNPPAIKRALLDYIERDGILQSLDFVTTAKAAFLRKFQATILAPRQLDYRVQFTGPTGANVVEAAIKLARKHTGRSSVVAFTNAYHGVSLGALALTGNAHKRAAAGIGLDGVQRLPYDGYLGASVDTDAFARKVFADPSSGMDLPAAFILETVQGEGGLNAASSRWLQAISALARDIGALLIIDDIQAGCGRTGTFFSFESLCEPPDIVCLSKSISGCGLPMSIALLRPQIDVWTPGEHNGTFRGNNLAFVGATSALDYWADSSYLSGLRDRTRIVDDALWTLSAGTLAGRATPVGRGLFRGLRFADSRAAKHVCARLLEHHVVAETCGPHDEVVKLMPATNTPEDLLQEGLRVLDSVASSM